MSKTDKTKAAKKGKGVWIFLETEANQKIEKAAIKNNRSKRAEVLSRVLHSLRTE